MIDPHLLWRRVTRLVGALVLAFLLAPILAIVPLSFNGSSLLSYPLEGVSLQWYAKLMAEPRWWAAIGNSLVVAAATVAIATPLGTLAALGLAMGQFRGKPLVVAFLMAPMVVPTIITAVGTYFMFARMGLANSLTGLILAHVVLATPFVVITVSAAAAQLDLRLLRAAASLGAGPVTAFRRVTLPLILPGVAAGGIFAFTTSFDEVVVAVLLTGPDSRTLPRELLSGTRENLDPTVMAVASLLILFSTLLLLAFNAVQARRG